MLDVKGDAFEDKEVTTTITINGTNPKEGANSFYYRCTSANGKNFYDIGGGAIDDTLLTLRGSTIFSNESYSGYWYTDQIVLSDVSGNERYEGSADFNYKLYIDNPLMDDEDPEYIRGSLNLELSKVPDGGPLKDQVLKVSYSFKENRWLKSALIRLVCIGNGKDSIDLYADGKDIDQVNHIVTHYVYIPEFYSSGIYEIREIVLEDRAGNNHWTTLYEGEDGSSIRITTPRPDNKGPDLNLNDISVSAVPANPAHPDGETIVTLKIKVKDDISGFCIGYVNFMDPLGHLYGNWIYPEWYGNQSDFGGGDPTVEREYTFTITLPKGSMPGTWGVSEITLTDFAMNNSVYNFTEIVHFKI